MNIEISSALSAYFSQDAKGFKEVMRLQGDVYRQVETRKTLRFEKENCGYFAKLHFGTGFGEVLKNLLMLKKPVMGARQEYDAIQHLEKHNVPTMTIAGFGECGRESFLITKELAGFESLKDLFEQDKKPEFSLRLKLIAKTAKLIRDMHASGLNHRDCYLAHVYCDLSSIKMALIDLHRSQVRKKVPRRWRVKDLSGLYFSAMDYGLSQRDFFRFIKIYSGVPLREVLKDGLWKGVKTKALALYQKEARKREG